MTFSATMMTTKVTTNDGEESNEEPIVTRSRSLDLPADPTTTTTTTTDGGGAAK